MLALCRKKAFSITALFALIAVIAAGTIHLKFSADNSHDHRKCELCHFFKVTGTSVSSGPLQMPVLILCIATAALPRPSTVQLQTALFASNSPRSPPAC